MTYKTIVIEHVNKTKKMAKAIENTANEYALKGWQLISFSITNSLKAILVFSTPDLESVSSDAVNQETVEATGEDE